MKYISVQGLPDGTVFIDDEDFDRVSMHKWYYNGVGNVQRRFEKRLSVGLMRKRKVTTYSLASEIMNKLGVRHDHINNNWSDNQKSNLREASISQNNANRIKYKRLGKSTSQFKGVSWYKKGQQWSGQISILGKKKHLGYFNYEVDAARAYNKIAFQIFKEFASLNKDEQGNIL